MTEIKLRPKSNHRNVDGKGKRCRPCIWINNQRLFYLFIYLFILVSLWQQTVYRVSFLCVLLYSHGQPLIWTQVLFLFFLSLCLVSCHQSSSRRMDTNKYTGENNPLARFCLIHFIRMTRSVGTRRRRKRTYQVGINSYPTEEIDGWPVIEEWLGLHRWFHVETRKKKKLRLKNMNLVT